MKKAFNQKLIKAILVLFGGMLALFFFRLAYGYTKTIPAQNNIVQALESFSAPRKNYATKKYSQKGTTAIPNAASVDQKYEKIAMVNTKSTSFEEDETLLREQIKSKNALIQFEQKNGNVGQRRLQLQIGVPPDAFDALYQKLADIGTVQSKQITKKDKTNEYKELNAKKASLEKILRSLNELKSKNGKIEEFISLENRILDIQSQMQALGVDLGQFDEENEFCTIQFSMFEGKIVKISFLHRVKVALEWTIKIYLRFMATLFFMSLFAYFLLLIIERTRKIISN